MKKLMTTTAMIISALFLVHQSMNAQWVQTNGPASGDVNAMAVIGSNLFAGSTHNGVFLSADNGANWSPVNTGLLNTTVFAFAVSGTGLFAGTDRGVFLSNNNGTSWSAVNTGLAALTVKALAMGGSDLFAGTDTGGVYYSSNLGSSWSAVNTGLTNKNVRALAFLSTRRFAGTYGGGVFRSTDNGAHWNPVNTGLTSLNVNTLYVNGANLYAGTDSGGVFLSTNNGTSWTKISQGIGPLTTVRAITSIGSTLFAGTLGFGVYVSTDNGTSWTLAQNGLPKINTLCFAVMGSNLFAGILGGGVYLSTNNAGSWTAVNNGMTTSVVLTLAPNGTTLFCGLFRNHCYTSPDNGATWNYMNTGLTAVSVMSFVVSGSTVYAGSDGGVFYTVNNGASWTPINEGLTPRYVSALAISGSTLYAGTSNGICVSTNNGTTWAQSSTGLPANTYIYSLLANGNGVFAGTAGAGVYRTIDNGAHWSAVNVGLSPTSYVQSLAASGSTVVAGTNIGVFLSTDNGAHWSEINNGLTDTYIHTVIVNGTTLYAGTDEAGVFTSDDNGALWTPLNTGLTNHTVNALAVSGLTLYAGTGGSGVLRMPLGPPPTFTISGNTGTGEVTLSWTDGTAKTAVSDAAGMYSISVSGGWSGTVTPSKSGFAFTPVSRSYANVQADLTAQNYALAAMYTISGTINGGGETLTWMDGTLKTTTASPTGAYSISVPAHWSGSVTPTKAGYLFSPVQRTYTNVVSNQTSQFYWTYRGVMISGNAGAPGVTVSCPDEGIVKTSVTDANGNYLLTVSSSYWGSVTPALAGCTFTPSQITYTGLRSNATNQNYTITSVSATVNVKVFLAGAFNGTAMTTGLGTLGDIPLSSSGAYASATYHYTAKTVTAIPSTAIVDWVVVELRTGTSAASRVAVQAGFLRSDGTIVDTDGSSLLAFPGIVPGQYYVVVRHRNHCAVMTASSIVLTRPSALYDFTTGMAQAYGTNPMVALAGGPYGMIGGDANRDGRITGSDYNVFSPLFTSIASGYEDADMNLDGVVTGSDYNVFSPAYVAIRSTQVPE